MVDERRFHEDGGHLRAAHHGETAILLDAAVREIRVQGMDVCHDILLDMGSQAAARRRRSHATGPSHRGAYIQVRRRRFFLPARRRAFSLFLRAMYRGWPGGFASWDLLPVGSSNSCMTGGTA